MKVHKICYMLPKNCIIFYLFSRKITSFKFAQKVQKILVPSVTPLLPVSINSNFHALNCITKLKSISFQQKKLHVNIFFHCCTIINQKNPFVLNTIWFLRDQLSSTNQNRPSEDDVIITHSDWLTTIDVPRGGPRIADFSTN